MAHGWCVKTVGRDGSQSPGGMEASYSKSKQGLKAIKKSKKKMIRCTVPTSKLLTATLKQANKARKDVYKE